MKRLATFATILLLFVTFAYAAEEVPPASSQAIEVASSFADAEPPIIPLGFSGSLPENPESIPTSIIDYSESIIDIQQNLQLFIYGVVPFLVAFFLVRLAIRWFDKSFCSWGNQP